MQPIAFVHFTDGVRPVYEEPDGRQYTYDNEGERVYGVFFVPREERDLPTVVMHRSRSSWFGR